MADKKAPAEDLCATLAQEHDGVDTVSHDLEQRGAAASHEAPDRSRAALEGSRAALRSRRVLVIDDNRDAATMLAVLIRDLGHSTMTAFDGDSAIALAQEFEPEIVFLDLVMPDADGIDIALGIRAQPGLQDCRIFVLSAYGSAEDRMRTLRAGCEEHYTKPVDPAILNSILGDLSGRG